MLEYLGLLVILFVLVFLLCITDPALFYQTFKGSNWCRKSFDSVFAPGRDT